jgi:hypothetical protein
MRHVAECMWGVMAPQAQHTCCARDSEEAHLPVHASNPSASLAAATANPENACVRARLSSSPVCMRAVPMSYSVWVEILTRSTGVRRNSGRAPKSSRHTQQYSSRLRHSPLSKNVSRRSSSGGSSDDGPVKPANSICKVGSTGVRARKSASPSPSPHVFAPLIKCDSVAVESEPRLFWRGDCASCVCVAAVGRPPNPPNSEQKLHTSAPSTHTAARAGDTGIILDARWL